MKLKRRLFALMFAFGVFATSVDAQLRASKNWRTVEAETVTLFSRAKHQNTPRTNRQSKFSFRYGVRSEVAPEITLNNFELQYGNFTWNGDSDWFTVSMVTDDRSRIKDLGTLQWSEILKGPYLPASVKPHRGVRFPARGQTLEDSSDGQVSKVVLGHMYVLHAKDPRSDLYALFRVEKLVPNDEVTISWKVVPAPKR